MECTLADVQTAITELRTGQQLTGTHHETFSMRPEQAEAVNKTHAYFHSIWKEDMHAVPRFLWNAKMRFGKTFATYQLAKKLGATQGAGRDLQAGGRGRVADTTSSPTPTSTAGSTSRKATGTDPTTADKKRPLVYFGSFQDLLGRDKAGNIKAKNTWLHETNWDLVVFDEYHFGAWRDNAKELFEGEDDAEAKKETAGRVQPRPRRIQRGARRARRERDRVPADHDQGLPLPLRHAVQGARDG